MLATVITALTQATARRRPLLLPKNPGKRKGIPFRSQKQALPISKSGFIRLLLCLLGHSARNQASPALMNSGKKTIFTYSRKNPITKQSLPLSSTVEKENTASNNNVPGSPMFLKAKRSTASAPLFDSPQSKRHCDFIKAALARADGRLGYLTSHQEKQQQETALSVFPQHITQRSEANGQDLPDLLSLLRQAEVPAFTDWFSSHNEGKVRKIGEATFSEVFTITNPEDGSISVVKIIPLAKDEESLTEDVLPLPISIPAAIHECKVLRRISMLKEHRTLATPLCYTGFNQLLALTVVRGVWPRELVRAWSAYTGPRENSSPARYSSSQLHLIICMQDGGVDLEHFKFTDSLQVRSIVCQIACALALAEERAGFEHRDLHLGNVLVKKVDPEMHFDFDGRCFPSQGLQCSIIDYSLSRVELQAGGEVMYRDLECLPWLFEGDGQKDAQYQVYKDMRQAVSGNWNKFSPKTNILWMSFLLQRLLQQAGGKRPKVVLDALVALKERILNYDSVSNMVQVDAFFACELNNRPEQ